MTASKLPAPAVLAGIRMLLMDVDGVLTDGRLLFDAAGNESKLFHVYDGAGLAWWHRCGGFSGWLSGRGGAVVEHRAKELGVHEVHLKNLDKTRAFEDVLQRRSLAPAQCAFIGDDLTDLPVLRRAGFSVCPANGRIEVQQQVHYVTRARGGEGAVREVVELLLQARGTWQQLLQQDGLR
jgi:3-deoxy-D-manno-octulosonate 8-phosphate phosphatase (KDO 8-P phosphatase)